MISYIIRAEILLIARIFTTQLAKYPHVLYAKPSNKVYLLLSKKDCRVGVFQHIENFYLFYCFHRAKQAESRGHERNILMVVYIPTLVL